MIIKYQNFIKGLSNYVKSNFYLFYGPNLGKVEHGADKLVNFLKINKNLTIISFSSQELIKGKVLDFFQNYDSTDIFGNSNLLIMSLADGLFNKEICEAVKNSKLSNLRLIIKSGPLEKRLSLRNDFEKQDHLLTIPCYEENNYEKKEIVRNYLKKEGININFQKTDELINLLSDQRFEIINELEKIVILTKLSKSSSINNLTQVVSKTAYFDEAKFIYSIFSGKKKSFFRDFLTFLNHEKNEILLIKMLSDHLYKILITKKRIESGKTFRESIKELKPPIFFKFEKDFKYQIDNWNEKEILLCLKKMIFAQKKILVNDLSSSSNLMFLILGFINKNLQT